MQTKEYTDPPHAFKVMPGSLGVSEPEITPPDADIERAAAVLNAGERVAILIGQGARRAAAGLTELAELTGGGIAKALLGRLLYEMLQPDSELDGWKDGSRP